MVGVRFREVRFKETSDLVHGSKSTKSVSSEGSHLGSSAIGGILDYSTMVASLGTSGRFSKPSS